MHINVRAGTKIQVRMVYAGTQSDRQAFVDVILQKAIADRRKECYHKAAQICGVYGGTEEQHDVRIPQ